MKAEELRVGNYVSLHGIPYKVIEIFVTGARLLNSENNYVPEYQYIYPIPLTPEILDSEPFKKAGFEKEGYDTYCINLYCYQDVYIDLIFVAYNRFYIREGLGMSYDRDDDMVKLRPFNNDEKCYVHQLQNLYYALVGEELNITL